MSNIRDNKVVEKEIMNPVWIDVNRVLEEELISKFVLRSFLVYEKERQNESRETSWFNIEAIFFIDTPNCANKI